MILKRMKHVAGFTIIEIMLAIGIMGILMTLAVPAYNAMIKSNCLTTSANNLLVSLQLARSIAIKHRSDVTVAANSTSSATNKWGDGGWTITIDEDRNGDNTLDAGEDYNGNSTLDSDATVRVMDVSSCSATTIDETSNDTSILYGSNGRANSNATFRFCDDRTGEQGRELTLDAIGRAKISKYTCT